MLGFEQVCRALEENLQNSFGAVETDKSGRYVFSWDSNGYEYDMYVDHFGEEGVQLSIRKQKPRRTYFIVTNTEYLTTEDEFYNDFREAVEYIEDKRGSIEKVNLRRAVNAFF